MDAMHAVGRVVLEVWHTQQSCAQTPKAHAGLSFPMMHTLEKQKAGRNSTKGCCYVNPGKQSSHLPVKQQQRGPQRDVAGEKIQNQIVKMCNQLKGSTFPKSAGVSLYGAIKADSKGLLFHCPSYIERKWAQGMHSAMIIQLIDEQQNRF